jgi:ribosomal-protein-alanine N-acetyltransferase
MLRIIKDQLPILINDQLMVNYISTKDKKDLFEIYSNESISKYVTRKTHVSIKETEEFIEVINSRIKEGSNLYLGIFHIVSKKLIGVIRFLKKEDPSTLTIGYALNESYWGKGVVPTVLNKLLELITLEGEFKKLRATVRPENIKSQRCLLKLGFELNGTFMKSDVIDGMEKESERLLFIRSL